MAGCHAGSIALFRLSNSCLLTSNISYPPIIAKFLSNHLFYKNITVLWYRQEKYVKDDWRGCGDNTTLYAERKM